MLMVNWDRVKDFIHAYFCKKYEFKEKLGIWETWRKYRLFSSGFVPGPCGRIPKFPPSRPLLRGAPRRRPVLPCPPKLADAVSKLPSSSQGLPALERVLMPSSKLPSLAAW